MSKSAAGGEGFEKCIIPGKNSAFGCDVWGQSITKADEYAKANTAGNYAVLLCRVLGGKVLYTDEVSPNPEDLVHQCVEGPYDSVLGDRERIRGTFREFVLFDSEDVYPEYIVEYQRDY
eukprot:TRINITY_DN28888_c0_g1_i2.p1 TRINITY_DN28888_c0_g1~~TRINITY_DN28888_c0_g1_i2.p1  ORF type:complete len:119 (+),score=20.95 TRINITY_DN28888_c0_g1_i2:307-663(+)